MIDQSPPAQQRYREHVVDGSPCWCNPRVEVRCSCGVSDPKCWLCGGSGWVGEEDGQPDAPRITIHSETVAGMPWSDIAASAYRAYTASMGNRNFRGDPMPEFDALPQPIRVAWEAAARQVGGCLTLSENSAPPDEQAWAGWLPPNLV